MTIKAILEPTHFLVGEAQVKSATSYTNIKKLAVSPDGVHAVRGQGRPHPYFNMTPLEPSNEDIFVNQIKGAIKKMTGA